MTIKLSELKAARAAMTPGPYAAAEANRDGFEFLEIRSPTREVVAMPDDEMADENAAGIVATHNAADVLIEIAEAAKAYEEANLWNGFKPDVFSAWCALRVALAKVTL